MTAESLLSVRDLSIAFRQGARETLAVDRVSFIDENTLLSSDIDGQAMLWTLDADGRAKERTELTAKTRSAAGHAGTAQRRYGTGGDGQWSRGDAPSG